MPAMSAMPAGAAPGGRPRHLCRRVSLPPSREMMSFYVAQLPRRRAASDPRRGAARLLPHLPAEYLPRLGLELVGLLHIPLRAAASRRISSIHFMGDGGGPRRPVRHLDRRRPLPGGLAALRHRRGGDQPHGQRRCGVPLPPPALGRRPPPRSPARSSSPHPLRPLVQSGPRLLFTRHRLLAGELRGPAHGAAPGRQRPGATAGALLLYGLEQLPLPGHPGWHLLPRSPVRHDLPLPAIFDVPLQAAIGLGM